MIAPTQRNHYATLDGMRGLAALVAVVILFHKLDRPIRKRLSLKIHRPASNPEPASPISVLFSLEVEMPAAHPGA